LSNQKITAGGSSITEKRDIQSNIDTAGRNYDLEDLTTNLDKTIVFVEDKFKAPLMGGNIVFRLFDDNLMTGVNRGFLVVTDTKEIYLFNGKYYTNNGELFIRDIMQTTLGISCCSRYKNETIDWIKDHGDLQILREDFDLNPLEIVLENCIYDVTTGEIKEHSPNNFPTTCFPIPYDPDAKCPTFMKFLEDVHYLEDIPLIQEMFGYCFYKPYAFQKAFMLVGAGANGKSTELNVLENLIGERNVSNIPLQRLCKDRFTNIDLIGKYANICSDLSEEGLKDIGTFKMLVGGDWIRAEKKYAPNGIKFRNTAKLIFSANTIPECKDKTFSYGRRWVVIEYPNVFREDDPNTDPFIEEKLIKEIPGIFLWAMEGLKRLEENKRFSSHKTLEEVQQYMAENRDSVKQFCDTCIEREIGGEILKSKIYNTYIDFCKTFGFNVFASNQFSMKMKQFASHTLDEGQSRVLKGKTWKGIKLKPVAFKGKKEEVNKTLKSGEYVNGVFVSPVAIDRKKGENDDTQQKEDNYNDK
jgi:putative DNA primase/helicase